MSYITSTTFCICTWYIKWFIICRIWNTYKTTCKFTSYWIYLWFNSNNLQLYAWYDDGTSKQWVSISQTGPKGDAQKVMMSVTPPATPVVGDLWFNINKSVLYAFYNDGTSSQWVSI